MNFILSLVPLRSLVEKDRGLIKALTFNILEEDEIGQINKAHVKWKGKRVRRTSENK